MEGRHAFCITSMPSILSRCLAYADFAFSIFTFLCAIAIGLSLGEIASIYPTAGGEFLITNEQSRTQYPLTFTTGQYHWVTALYPVRGRKFIAWMTGWITIRGHVVLTASIAFARWLMTQALITTNSQSYRSTRWQALLLYWVVLFYGTVMNLWGSKLLSTANLISGKSAAP